MRKSLLLTLGIFLAVLTVLSISTLSLVSAETNVASGRCGRCSNTGDTIDLSQYGFDQNMPIHVVVSVTKGDGSDHFQGSANYELNGLNLKIYTNREKLDVNWFAIQSNEAVIASGSDRVSGSGETINLSSYGFDPTKEKHVFVGIARGDGSDHFQGNANYDLNGSNLRIFSKNEVATISWIVIQSDSLNIASGRCGRCSNSGDSIDLSQEGFNSGNVAVMIGITRGDGSDHFDGSARHELNGTDLRVYTLKERLDVNWLAIQKDSVTPSNGKPVITLIGNSVVTVNQNSNYADQGATAFDAEDGDITSNIIVTGSVNTAVIGNYTISYNVVDSDNLAADTVTRTVRVVSGSSADKNSTLNIFDSSDLQNVTVNSTITFFAEYVDSTNGNPIESGVCTIRFNTGNGFGQSQNMTYNSAEENFFYSTMFSQAGTFEFRVSCEDSQYEDQQEQDSFVISSTIPEDNDQDDDGVPDDEDNCPNTYNPNQEDNDNDGIGDVCDPSDDSEGDNGDDGNGANNDEDSSGNNQDNENPIEDDDNINNEDDDNKDSKRSKRTINLSEQNFADFTPLRSGTNLTQAYNQGINLNNSNLKVGKMSLLPWLLVMGVILLLILIVLVAIFKRI